MKRLACALLALPLALAAGRAQDKMTESSWYPLRVGTKWHYKSGDKKFLMQVAGHEKVGDVLCARVEMVKDGKVTAVEHIAVTGDGVVRKDLELRRDNNQPATETPTPPILILKLPPKKGDTFTVDSKAAGKAYKGTFKVDEEEVTVPAGTYKNAVSVTGLDLEVDGLKPTIVTWYADNVGMIKQVVSEAGQKIVVELEKFEPGGK
jgi:hypothetical protein